MIVRNEDKQDRSAYVFRYGSLQFGPDHPPIATKLSFKPNTGWEPENLNRKDYYTVLITSERTGLPVIILAAGSGTIDATFIFNGYTLVSERAATETIGTEAEIAQHT
jgi:hypothetical protein